MTYKKQILWICVLCWMALIFGFSGQNGTKSEGMSEKVADQAVRIVKPDYTKLDQQKQLSLRDTANFVVRKSAHFTEYFILGILVTELAMCYAGIRNITFYAAALVCAAYASLDEWHQSFVGGRQPALRDVLIDTLGSITGIFVILLIQQVKHKRKPSVSD